MDIGSIGMLWIGVAAGGCMGALAMGVLMSGRIEYLEALLRERTKAPAIAGLRSYEETLDEVTA